MKQKPAAAKRVATGASKRSRPAAAPEIPLPVAKRTDPPTLPIPTDPRTWPEWQRALHGRRYFARPQAPWSFDHGLAPEIVAAQVVREVVSCTGVARFPEKRWADWLTRRALALYRVHRVFRARMDGPHERLYCYTYLRNWLYTALRRTGWKYADLLPPEMWAGQPPLREAIPEWKRWRLPTAA
jgi:hypothetical protein